MNVPNTLSLIRLLMVPVFAIVFFHDPTPGYWWAAGLYVLVSATDLLDGYIARSRGQITKLGRVLDPLADKLMSACVLICIAIEELVPWWAVAVFLAKELLMGIGALVEYKHIDDVAPSGFFGKFAMVFFFVTCLIIMTIPVLPAIAAEILIAVALFLTIAAFFSYAIRFSAIMKKH